MYAAAEVALETETGTVTERQVIVTVCNSRLMPSYFKISKNVQGLSSDPVVWEGIPTDNGTAVTFPVCDNPLRISIYSQKPSATNRAALRIGYIFIDPDEVKNLKKLSLIIYVDTIQSMYDAYDALIAFEFNDGSTREKKLIRR
jgi:hypothetical protein